MKRRIISLVLLCLMLCSCSMQLNANELLSPPRLSYEQSAIYDAIELAIGSSSFNLKYPENGSNLSACTLKDLDNDGNDEVIAFYELEGKSSSVWLCILKQENGKWKCVKQIPGTGTEIERLEFAHIVDKNIYSVIVGWTSIGDSSSDCSTYIYKDGTINKSDKSYTYNDMLISDINDDGRDEVVLCTINASRAPKMGLLQGVEGKVVHTSTISLPTQLSSYVNLQKGKLTEGLNAVVADIELANGLVDTVLVGINTSKTKTTLENIYINEISDFENCERSQEKAISTDINNDGFIDIPRLHSNENDASEDGIIVETVDYYSVVDGELKIVGRTAINETDGYQFVFPNNWDNLVGVASIKENQELIFSISNTNESEETGIILLKIRTVSKSDYIDIYETEDYKTVATKGAYEYQVCVGKDMPAGYEITDEEITNLFKLL